MSPSAPARTLEQHLLRYRELGDPADLGAAFDATAPVLFRMAMAWTHDATAAEDALQETFVVALEHLDRWDAGRPAMPWLVGILHMRARAHRRDVRRVPDAVRVAAAHPGPAEGEGAVDEALEHGEDAAEIRRAIDALEEPYRSVALLRWRYGLSPAEIADVRGEHPGTTRSLLSRALGRMRGALRATAALLILPAAAKGLDAVREAVLAHAAVLRGASEPVGIAASAAPATPVSATVAPRLLGMASGRLALVAASAALVIGGGLGAVLAWRAGDARGGSAPVGSTPAEPGAPVPGETAPPPMGLRPRHPESSAPPPPDVAPDSGATPPEREEAASPSGLDPAPAIDEPVMAPPLVRPADAPVLGVDPAMGANAPPPPAPSPEPLPAPTGALDEDGVDRSLSERIEDAVKHGVRWLKQRQLPDGSFGLVEGNAAYEGTPAGGDAYKHPAGTTGLALYALLKCGESAEDPVLKRGFKFLKDRHKLPGGAYETAVVLLAVTATADPFRKTKDSMAAGDRVRLAPELRDWAQRLQSHLVKMRADAKALGWRYNLAGQPAASPADDLSSTQMVALALFAAERCGIKTEARVWNDLVTFALAQQEKDGPAHPRAVLVREGGAAKEGGAGARPAVGGGTAAGPAGGAAATDRARGFAYALGMKDPDEGEATGGMTACGLGTILMARNVLFAREDKTFLARDPAAIQQAVFDGLAWLDRNWSAYANPKKKKTNVYHVYWQYCVERACDLIGNRRLGAHLWYVEMARELVGRQTAKGYWDSDSTHKPGEVLDTSFALLFLRRSLIDVIPGGALTDTSPEARDGR